MIEFHLDTTTSILHVRPKSSLEKGDFEQLARDVDPFIEEVGDLAGLIIETPAFPGWFSFGALVAHLRFVRDHHKHIKRIALVTDSPMGDVAEHLGSHFISAEVKHFPASAPEEAAKWVLETPSPPASP